MKACEQKFICITIHERICPDREISQTSREILTNIRVDLAGILGRRMARAEGGLVPSGVGCGDGCPFFSRLGGLGERLELPSGVRDGF